MFLPTYLVLIGHRSRVHARTAKYKEKQIYGPRCNSGFISCNNLKFQLTPFDKTKIFDIYIFVLAMPLLLKRVLKPPHPDLCRQYPIMRSVSSKRTIRTETQRKTQTGLQGSFPLGEMLLDLNSCRKYS